MMYRVASGVTSENCPNSFPLILAGKVSKGDSSYSRLTKTIAGTNHLLQKSSAHFHCPREVSFVSPKYFTHEPASWQSTSSSTLLGAKRFLPTRPPATVGLSMAVTISYACRAMATFRCTSLKSSTTSLPLSGPLRARKSPPLKGLGPRRQKARTFLLDGSRRTSRGSSCKQFPHSQVDSLCLRTVVSGCI
jgi:hypothetical protein